MLAFIDNWWLTGIVNNSSKGEHLIFHGCYEIIIIDKKNIYIFLLYVTNNRNKLGLKKGNQLKWVVLP